MKLFNFNTAVLILERLQKTDWNVKSWTRARQIIFHGQITWRNSKKEWQGVESQAVHMLMACGRWLPIQKRNGAAARHPNSNHFSARSRLLFNSHCSCVPDEYSAFYPSSVRIYCVLFLELKTADWWDNTNKSKAQLNRWRDWSIFTVVFVEHF